MMTNITTPTDSKNNQPDATAADERLTVIRHEEQLVVDTETVETERVRLEKYIVSEERTITVTVRREEVRLIREPLDGAKAVESRDRNAERPRIMILSEERIVLSTEIVPVERVWLRTQLVTEHQKIDESTQHEQVDLVEPD